MTSAAEWADLAPAGDDAPDVHTAAWWRHVRDAYVARYPSADRRSLDNLDDIVRDAERREKGA